MKIAFVFPPMWTPHSDGSLQIWNSEITTRLAKQFEVLVYSGTFGLCSEGRVNGVQYRRFSTRWDARFLERFGPIRSLLGIRGPLFSSDLWYLGYALKVALDLRKQNCQVAHVYNYPQFAALIRRFNPSLRIVLNVHGEVLTQVEFNKLSSRLLEIDLVAACSESVTRPIRERFPRVAARCRTVPMGISEEVFPPRSEGCGLERPCLRRLLYVGRISPEKGVHILLKAFELVIRDYPDATLTVVGPEWVAPREDLADLCLGRETMEGLAPFYTSGYLSSLKRSLGVEAARRVTFAGLIAHNDLASYYASADVYVSPSLYESFGMSIIEAMASGLPVVATQCGGVTESIVNRECGLLVEAASPTAIASAVRELFSDARLRSSIARAGHDMARKQFCWESVCAKLVEAYHEGLETRAA